MFNIFYGDALNDWFNEHNKWLNGTHSDLVENPELKEKYPFYAMWNGNPPDIEYYQKVKYSDNELTHIQLYETTSEGTPKSPVFSMNDLMKLCEWAAENATTFGNFTATKEQWYEMLSKNQVYHSEGNMIFS